MDFRLSTEQSMLQDGVKRFLRAHHRSARQTALNDVGAMWPQFAESGWLRAGVPEDWGGFNGSMVETSIIMEEFGRSLVAEPYMASAVFATQLMVAGASPEQKHVWLPSILDGESIATVAYREPDGSGDPLRVNATATLKNGSHLLQGRKVLVPYAQRADLFLVSAKHERASQTADALSVFIVPADTAGVTIRPYRLVDGTEAGDVEFNEVVVGPDSVLGKTPGEVLPAFIRSLNHAIMAVCAEAIGAAEQAIEETRDYLKTRKQFGVAIATFQSLRHRMADMVIDLEMARSMGFKGLALLEQSDEAAHIGISACKFLIARNARRITEECIQLHGAMGMTDECNIGHFYKRIAVIDTLFGNSAFHLQQYTHSLRSSLRPS